MTRLAGQTPPRLGVIEGYYGRPWSWDERAETMRFLASHGYEFFLYAPKADAFLRRRWREPHPDDQAEQVATFAALCHESGVAFGVGLSPFELYRDFNDQARTALATKLRQLDDLGVRYLAILFDDMRGDLPGLAQAQADILHWIAGRSRAERLIVCPTYYSDDPALDRFFGARPARYLEDLGAALDPAVEVFWTGPEVCSRELTPGHLARVADRLGRKVLLWDNYPVNDGPRMSPFLHIRAFTGRPASLGACVVGHAINPALQPVLTRIPALSLVESYRLGDRYDYGVAFDRAARHVLGESMGAWVADRLSALQDVGLDGLGEGAGRLRLRLAGLDGAGAREIVAWLDGSWRITAAELAES